MADLHERAGPSVTRRTHTGWPRMVGVQDSAGLCCRGRWDDARAYPQATEEAPPETEPGGAVVTSVCSGSSIAVAARRPVLGLAIHN
jgi:hypothetical protein